MVTLFIISATFLKSAVICHQENTYAFGDSYNDAPMLRAAAHPYLMNIAPADLKAEFATQIDDVTGVLKTLGH